MTLTTYNKKRKFSGKGKTTEPKMPRTPAGPKESKKLIFVVQEHHASHLHWDLRLEMHGTLASWAVPKGPPLKTGIKRLAMHVEDHPMAYATFHGTIPEGNYGAGTVKIWDHGNYDLLKNTDKEIEVFFHGKKLKGKYVLVKTRYGSRPDKSWLLFKA